MDLLPLQLAANKGAWLRFQSRKRKKGFETAQKKILSRDDHTCRYCGFRSERYQEVMNLDQDYENNKPSNLVTACSFCTQCFFLDGLGMSDHFGGLVVYLPELSQADLNNFCRVLFCSLNKETPYKSRLQAVYLSLRDRSAVVEKVFGPNSSEPQVFGQALMDCGLPPEQLSLNVLSQLRLLPIRSFFKEQIAYWNATIYSRFPL